MEIFSSDNVEWSSKNLRKMISADVKANKKKKRNKGAGDCILLLIRSTFKTWNTIILVG